MPRPGEVIFDEYTEELEATGLINDNKKCLELFSNTHVILNIQIILPLLSLVTTCAIVDVDSANVSLRLDVEILAWNFVLSTTSQQLFRQYSIALAFYFQQCKAKTKNKSIDTFERISQVMSVSTSY